MIWKYLPTSVGNFCRKNFFLGALTIKLLKKSAISNGAVFYFLGIVNLQIYQVVNCSLSVEPSSAVVDACPPVIVIST